MKSLETTSLCSVWKKKLFDNIILNQNLHGILPKVVEITI
jgi:hypothetical protein